MNKKVVVLGGGSGLSILLRGLKLFPVDITAIVSMADDGGSGGVLRDKLDIPSIGDFRKVIASLSESGPLMEEMLQYRFETEGELNNHTVGNFMLAALVKKTGSVGEAVKALGKLVNIKGKIVPLSEDKATLVVKTTDGRIIECERNIEKTKCIVKDIYYKEKIKVTVEAINEILDADFIIISMGSLYASIISILIIPEVVEALKKSHAKKMFISNLMTETGTTNGLKVSDFIKVFNKYLGKDFFDAVFVNNGKIDKDISKRYKNMEESIPIIFDKENLTDCKFKLIEDNYVKILEEKDIYNIKRVDKMVRHDPTKLAFSIFTYIMNEGD